MRWFSLLFLSFALFPFDTRVFACTGNEYWPETPGWLHRTDNDIELSELRKTDSQITDNYLRAALRMSGVTPCPGVEKDLVSSSMKVQRAVRSATAPVTRQRGFLNYDEITQVMIRHVLRPNAVGVLEVLTRTKICKAGDTNWVTAPPEYQSNAAELADKITESLTALLSGQSQLKR